MGKEVKKKVKPAAPKDADGKVIKVGCHLCSKLFPDQKVICESVDNGGVWLKQLQDGSITFFVVPETAQWVVTKYPDEK